MSHSSRMCLGLYSTFGKFGVKIKMWRKEKVKRSKYYVLKINMAKKVQFLKHYILRQSKQPLVIITTH